MQAANRLLIKAVFDDARRVADGDRIGRDVLCHDRVCADDRAVADAHAAHQAHVIADPHVAADDDLPAVDGGMVLMVAGFEVAQIFKRIRRDVPVVVILPDVKRQTVCQRGVPPDKHMPLADAVYDRAAHEV